MSKVIHIEGSRPAAVTAQGNELLRRSCFATAWGLLIVGLVMIVMCFLTPVGVILTIIEVILGAANLAAAAMMFQACMRKHTPFGVTLLAGDLGLGGTFFYLGTSMPAFHQGMASLQVAVIQLIAVLLGLFLNGTALAIAGASEGVRRAGRINGAAGLRDSVILIVGTILLAISLSQLAGNALKPTQWNWFSYLSITVPGMVILTIRECVKQVTENWAGFKRVVGLVGTEVLLIAGLTVMLFGSYSNLTLGTNGYMVHIKGNPTGLALWTIAVLFLVLVRGPLKLAFLQRSRRVSREVISQFLYVAALIAFIYGERSIVSGMAPKIIIGNAAPEVLLILLGGLLLVVVGRVIGRGRVVAQ